MMQSAGGVTPSLLACDEVWTSLAAACGRWADNSLGLRFQADVTTRSPLSSKYADEQIREQFGYVCLPSAFGGLRALSISAPLAGRYVARRLKEDIDKLTAMPALFLRLMCDKPARALWAAVADAVPVGQPLPEDFAVVDPSGVPGSLDDAGRLLQVTVALRDKADAEGLSDPVLLHFYYELESLETFAQMLESRAADVRKTRPVINRDALRRSIRSSSIGLEAILTDIPLTVGECSDLKVGQVVDLDNAEAGKLSLHAKTLTGSVEISKAEMGTWKGQRAVKLTTPLLESFVQEISGT
jgi:hypothetical protein